MFQQRQELHPTLANFKRNSIRVGREVGSYCTHTCAELALITFGLAWREEKKNNNVEGEAPFVFAISSG